ncbi:MAG: response regulator transcription factor [Eubacteriales bacterium]
MRVLIVEDEKRLAMALSQIFSQQGWMTDEVHDGQDGLDYGLSGIYDVIVLDVMLPRKDGFSVAKELRRSGIRTPILMLTAKYTVPDKVSGLDSGADDYMTKPFAPEELLARIRALSRRQEVFVGDTQSFSDISFSSSTSTLTCGEKSIHLNFKEAEIVKLLLSRPGAILPKEEIITKVWGYESDACDGNVEAYMSFIRKKLSFLGSKVQIVAIKKQGYRLEAGDA